MVPCDWANSGSVDFFFTWWVWFYLWGVDATLGNGYGVEEQNYVVLLQESEMYAGFCYRDLILVI